MVSLISPRRTFAVVKPTTKHRVDLGLRLENATPGGRMLAARNVGSDTINVRIALGCAADVDGEEACWLRQAYEENTAPPGPRRPARRPAPELGTLTVVVEGSELPGLSCHPDGGVLHQNVHVAVCGRDPDREAWSCRACPAAIEPVPGSAPSARWASRRPSAVARTASTSPGRTSVAHAWTVTSAWPGATFLATGRCGSSAEPSSGSPTWTPR